MPSLDKNYHRAWLVQHNVVSMKYNVTSLVQVVRLVYLVGNMDTALQLVSNMKSLTLQSVKEVRLVGVVICTS